MGTVGKSDPQYSIFIGRTVLTLTAVYPIGQLLTAERLTGIVGNENG